MQKGSNPKAIKGWKKEALALHLNFGYNGAEIGRKLGRPARTVQDNLKRFKDNFPTSKLKEMVKDAVGESNYGGAKILFHDIETSLAVSYHFGQWQQNLGIDNIVHPSHLLSHAWAWGDGEVTGSILTRDEVLKRDEERLVLEAWTLLDKCDVYVAHNAKKFDVKKLNGYFLKFGLPPPSPYKIYDTLQVSRKMFGLPFHNLKFLAMFLGVPLKIENSGISLWVDCAKGVQSALDEMMDYNIGDIVTLRAVYKKLISWNNDAVNMALYRDVEEGELVCTHCGSTSITQIDSKFAYTAQRKYQLYRCNTCETTLRGGTQSGDDKKLYRII